MPRTWLLHPYRYIQTMDQNHPGKENITAQLGFFFPLYLLFKGLSLGKFICRISSGGGIVWVNLPW